MLIKGNPEFVNKLRTVVEKISEESFVDVEYCDNESNSISFYGWVECKEVFSKLNVYKFQCDVFWINGDDKISALDRSELKKYQNKYMSLKQWMAVKQINVFLMELDNYEKRIIVSYYPRNLQVEHTNICNARCIMCTHYFNKNHNGTFVNDEFIDRIRPVLPYLERITLHGIGEPFLHPNIIDYIRLYSS